MAAKTARIGAIGAINAIPIVGPGIVDGIEKGVKIHGQMEWDQVKCDLAIKAADKGLQIIEDGADDLKNGCLNGCYRVFNRSFALISTYAKFVLACAVQAGIIGIGYLSHKMRTDEFCTKQPEDIGCQAAKFAFISTVSAGSAGAAYIGYRAAHFLTNEGKPSADTKPHRKQISGSTKLEQNEERLRESDRLLDEKIKRL